MTRLITVRAAVFAPVALSIAALGLGAAGNVWALAAIPFIWLGSVCSAPNLNLADGCLAYAAMLGGLAVAGFHPALGEAIMCGAAGGFLLSAIEKYLRRCGASE